MNNFQYSLKTCVDKYTCHWIVMFRRPEKFRNWIVISPLRYFVFEGYSTEFKFLRGMFICISAAIARTPRSSSRRVMKSSILSWTDSSRWIIRFRWSCLSRPRSTYSCNVTLRIAEISHRRKINAKFWRTLFCNCLKFGWIIERQNEMERQQEAQRKKEIDQLKSMGMQMS